MNDPSSIPMVLLSSSSPTSDNCYERDARYTRAVQRNLAFLFCFILLFAHSFPPFALLELDPRPTAAGTINMKIQSPRVAFATFLVTTSLLQQTVTGQYIVSNLVQRSTGRYLGADNNSATFKNTGVGAKDVTKPGRRLTLEGSSGYRFYASAGKSNKSDKKASL